MHSRHCTQLTHTHTHTHTCTHIHMHTHIHTHAHTRTHTQLALSAASPIFRGYLADLDTRWSAISASGEDRTEEERGLKVGHMTE